MLKKSIYLISTITLSFTLFTCSAIAASSSELKLKIDGKMLTSQQPLMIASSVFVPVDTVKNFPGFRIEWDNQTKTATIINTENKETIQITAGQTKAYKNKRVITMAAPLHIIQGKAYVPFRFVGESLGAKVNWDQKSRTVSISTNQPANHNNDNQNNSLIHYFKSIHTDVTVHGDDIRWQQGNVSFTAQLTESTGEGVHESDKVVSSMKIQSGEEEYTPQLESAPLRINSLSLSSAHYLAVDVSDHEGTRLIIVDLTDGSYKVLNQLQKSATGSNSEKIDAYNWSPDGSQIAFGIGNLGSSYIAMYDTKNQKISLLSQQNYSLITGLAWATDGHSFSFIAEDADSVMIYRYNGHKVAKTGTISEKDRQELINNTPKFY